ncbi:MAG: AAA family ATPase, partial [Halanaerobiales bacterium]|nr:AAA family ATPase [Halanaerobiales bacterium]
MSKIPYGLSDFYQLRREDYIYIDKTRFIEVLESYGEKYIFFLRPRRFGKTLFLSTLEYYYGLEHKENFDQLFSDLYIGKNKTNNASSYYILKFDFSGIETKDNIETDFLNEIRDSISKFMDKYNFNFEYRKTNNAHTELQNFLTKLGTTVEEKVYLLIDEYDHFANEILGFETIDSFENTVSRQGFLRKFFEVIKKKSGEVIDRLFVTGVSPITLDSMTSGFNIASNLTTDPNFNQVLGFTLTEVKEILDKISFAEENKDELLLKLKEYYNGYLFSQYAEEKIFNSDMVLYYFNNYQKLNREVDELVDSSIASDYSKLQNLFSLQDKKRNFAILEDIIAGYEQIGKITREFNLEKNFNKKDFLSLLFYLGFLTISREESGLIYFKVPNYAIKEVYFDFFAGIIENDSGTDALEIETSVIEILKNGKIENFITKV